LYDFATRGVSGDGSTHTSLFFTILFTGLSARKFGLFGLLLVVVGSWNDDDGDEMPFKDPSFNVEGSRIC
jgi:hypothetical protein